LAVKIPVVVYEGLALRTGVRVPEQLIAEQYAWHKKLRALGSTQ
jgi:hypothetical protein